MECHICFKDEVKKILDMGLQPVCHKYFKYLESEEKKYKLSLGQCEKCGLIQLTDRFPEKELKPIYDWIKYNEPENHLNELVKTIKNLPGLNHDSTIAGISLKDDSLLNLIGKEGFTNVQSINYDKGTNIGVETIQRILNQNCAQDIVKKQGKFDLIIARHILEHSYNWKSFMEAIHTMLNPNGYVVFEVPDSTTIFTNYDYSSIWEEHTLYFTETTFRNSLSFFNFSVNKLLKFSSPVEDVIITISQKDSLVKPQYPELTTLKMEIERAHNFILKFPEVKQKIKSYFSKRRNKIALFGAGHIACTYINLFDLEEDLLCVIDDDPMKQGLYMPGSKLPIKNSMVISKSNLDQVIFALNPEIENKIMFKFQEFIKEGGCFLSTNPISSISINSALRGYSETNEGVYCAEEEIIKLGVDDIGFLKQDIKNTEKKRTRVCVHKHQTDGVHEMFIALDGKTYLRPHKHIDKSESFHIVEGSAEVVVFNDDGTIKDVIEMGDFNSGKKFFYRINKAFYHTVLVKSDNLVLHEVTKGPFNKNETIFASWSPGEEENTQNFQKDLYSKIENFKNSIQRITK